MYDKINQNLKQKLTEPDNRTDFKFSFSNGYVPVYENQAKIGKFNNKEQNIASEPYPKPFASISKEYEQPALLPDFSKFESYGETNPPAPSYESIYGKSLP